MSRKSWSGHHYGCRGLANYNRRWFGSWENMYLIRTTPTSQGVDDPYEVYY